VTVFASHWGVKGGMIGTLAGTAVFASLAVLTAYMAVARLTRKIAPV